MKVSIVTVSFNAAETIGQTIDSVRSQDYPQIEHIIIDGASHDETMSIVQSRATANMVIVSEPDRGLYDAMNKGIERATGDVIGILNADDYLADPCVVSRIVKAFSDNPNIDAVLGDIEFLPDRYGLTRRYDSGRFKPERIGWGWMPAHPGMYLTRAAYDRVGKYSLDYRIAADFDFIIRAFSTYRLSFRHLPDVFVKMRPGGLSTSGLKSKWLINKEMLRACQRHGVHSSWPKITSKYFYKLLEYFKR